MKKSSPARLCLLGSILNRDFPLGWIPICCLLVAISGAFIVKGSAADEKGATDKEWTPLYSGTLDDFRIYFRGQGYIENVHDQEIFLAEPGQIHVVKGTNGLIVTKQLYRDYHVKVDYRWGAEGGSKNAGLMTHVDLDSKCVEDNRPRSIEINMREDSPGSFWLASGLGPFGSTFIEKDTDRYLPETAGGVRHDASPFGDRTIHARYPDEKINTNPDGEWNTLEAIVHGSDSVQIILNGRVVNHLTNLRIPKNDTKNPGEPLVEGGIGLQSEGQEVFYRNFVIKKLDP